MGAGCGGRRHVFLPSRKKQRRRDGDAEDHHDGRERNERRDVDQAAERELGRGEEQHHRQPDAQEAQLADHPGEQEVERAQAEQREDVRAVDEERDRASRRIPPGWNRPRTPGRWSRSPRAPPASASPSSALACAPGSASPRAGMDRHHAREPARAQRAALLHQLRLLLFAAQHAVRRIGEQRGERVDGPVQALEQLHAERDQHGAHGERTGDAPEQHARLQRRRDAGKREDEDEDEQVVDREGLLEQVGSEVRDARLAAMAQRDPAAEADAETDPDRAPQPCPARSAFISRDGEIDRQRGQR